VIAQRIIDWLGARQAVLAVVLACAVLTYGGVSLFVVAFAVYPIAVELFREVDLPKRLVPGSIALGAFTFTMTALPGTPAIQNAIPTPFFGTTLFAAPGLGLICGAVMLLLGLLWLQGRVRQARRAGEGYGSGHEEVAAGLQGAPGGLPAPGFAPAVAPIVAVVLLNWVFSAQLLPRLDSAYLATPVFGGTRLETVLGTWSIISALALSIGLQALLTWRGRAPLLASLEAGANACLLPLFNTASQVGYGAVIASLAGFVLIRDAVLGMAPGNPLISLSVAVNLLAGITGSASGGMSIALQTLGSTYLEMGRTAGISPELLHRVTAVATGGLDALPHNGAVITLLAICKLSHRQAYKDIFMVAVVAPLVALAVLVALGSALGTF
jgi:H+/gluconate symporter-like permease